MASLVRLTPEKGAYVIRTGTREQCESDVSAVARFDKFAHKSVFVIMDEKGFVAISGAKGDELSRGEWNEPR